MGLAGESGAVPAFDPPAFSHRHAAHGFVRETAGMLRRTLARTTKFMLTEEAHHMFVGEFGISRVIQRTCEVVNQLKTDDLAAIRAARHGHQSPAGELRVRPFQLSPAMNAPAELPLQAGQPRRDVQDAMRQRAADVLRLLTAGDTDISVCGLKGMEQGGAAGAGGDRQGRRPRLGRAVRNAAARRPHAFRDLLTQRSTSRRKAPISWISSKQTECGMG